MSSQYLYQRAEAELRMARLATCDIAAKVHYELANRYLDRFFNPEGERIAADRAETTQLIGRPNISSRT